MKILIFSKDSWEISTEMVIDWLIHFDYEWTRINGDSFETVDDSFKVVINDKEIKIIVNQTEMNSDEIHSIWLRRWGNDKTLDKIRKLPVPKELQFDLIKNQKDDQIALKEFVLHIFKTKNNRFLTESDKTSINKQVALSTAINVGLNIPSTIITNRKENLLEFAQQNDFNIICKDISTSFNSVYEDDIYCIYTSKVTQETIDKLPESFPASLFQENIEKEYEIRSFFLESKLYSMAIFSQSDDQTRTDFRNYNFKKPNRMVPYLIPDNISTMLVKFMDILGYQTGSFDLLKAKNGKYYFLEMNPVGQFGMVSIPCNYNIEKDIAKYLIDNGERY